VPGSEASFGFRICERAMTHLYKPLPYTMVWDVWEPPEGVEGGMPSDRLVSYTHDLIHKIVGIKDLRKKWLYYLYVRPAQTNALFEEWEKGSIFLHFHGHLLADCAGWEPTEDVKHLMKTRYGYVA
jgi:hypothetical protein